MPPSPTKKHETNGHAGPVIPGKGKGLANRLRDAFKGTDDIVIGGDIEVDDSFTTATMEDAAKLITSVRYLVKGWIPYGMVTGLIAEPGVGKSSFALWLARTLMTGGNWFTGLQGPKPGPVLWCATENDMAITKGRMEEWKIPFKRLILPFVDPLEPINLLDEEHVARLEQAVAKYKPRAVIVDSLRGSYDGDENDSRSGKVLKNLAAVAERTNVAVIVVHHTRKLADGEEISANSSRGSNAIIALFRAQLGFDRPDPESPFVRVRMLKENLGLAPKPIGFCISSKGLKFGEAPLRPGKDTQKAKAEDWLRDYLKDGAWHLRNDVMSDAAQFDFSPNAIQRAREELGITTASGNVRKRKDDNLYEWRLPTEPNNPIT